MRERLTLYHDGTIIPMDLTIENGMVFSVCPTYDQFLGKPINEFLDYISSTYQGTLIANHFCLSDSDELPLTRLV